MTPRMKWLLLACSAVFGLYGIDALYRSSIEEPRTALTQKIDTLTEEIWWIGINSSRHRSMHPSPSR
jgi:hypothetical protein